ncbi:MULTISPECIES: GNAT family N-acetyltransferase [unclassified Pseudomonas]|jgi:RimJ/RimL family protein N-acetyltransferase|uniref:GNAT family N-acetyltransferase n=1 Tax=unclassified Pseudomonas TaxID=196821 RepID=UPI001E2D9CD0|nr:MULTISPECIES: GNAT family protein [unclassified Pseudomonas]MCE0916340.1 GNAT family N-acetyltransferase [Pseudomonas sp. NMI760_13]MCP8632360.1 GNAT family N-acetyltransferase [Pseudomonas sp. DVZ6]MDC0688247.1 GNAT family protein [Mitsuaria sp. RG]MDD7782484.1 GNAT family protein [Pseudomonas sp. DVZ24]
MSIKGQRIVLRALELEDLPALHRWSNDEALWSLLGGWHFPVSREAQKEWLLGLKNDPMNQRFGIETLDHGLIGTANLVGIDWKNGTAEHGMMIGDSTLRGKGYGTEVIGTVMRYAFDELGLHRLWTTIIEYNEASLATYTRKVPWTIEGVQRQWYYRKGRRWDRVVLGVTVDDYRNWLEQQEQDR